MVPQEVEYTPAKRSPPAGMEIFNIPLEEIHEEDLADYEASKDTESTPHRCEKPTPIAIDDDGDCLYDPRKLTDEQMDLLVGPPIDFCISLHEEAACKAAEAPDTRSYETDSTPSPTDDSSENVRTYTTEFNFTIDPRKTATQIGDIESLSEKIAGSFTGGRGSSEGGPKEEAEGMNKRKESSRLKRMTRIM
ncbi:hypothetical protein K458DRAFT_392634 [Lentithecium fluviatile CBS 122367]|uniref:Uncharacterized protein n=1 Tax=Lentithecium fluviatile CBS 122367 TaxID=1168545 RepID=A0A6G1IRJ2_9PLEO|nr:hypothetical protein K458DRAFT_392634 [Lentithecium fluviatile CBS 122367]